MNSVNLKWIFTIIIVSFVFTLVEGQTALSAGDIAITGYNQHTHDLNGNGERRNGEFSFVLLTDITSGTIIKFTDRGWTGSQFTSGSNGEEGVLSWVATENMNCGSQIVITLDHDNNPTETSGNTSIESDKFKLKEKDGDQILAYQGSNNSPTFLFAVNWRWRWNGDNDKKETQVPTGLTVGTNALQISNDKANASYDCSVESGASLILSAIADNNNWVLATHSGHADDSGSYLTLGNCTFSCCVNTTWNGSSWSCGPPNNTKDVIIDGNYHTNQNSPGSFSAKNITVNSGHQITIGYNRYIEIENNIIVDGNMVVQTKGSVVQINPLGTVVENGSIKAIKRTASMNNYYEYTYWSSPVSSETIGGGLEESQPGSTYSFSAANFLDSTMESNNDNTTISGQDDIDDNGNDWTYAGSSTTMIPGVGYVSMHSSDDFSGSGTQYDYTFEGPFNNGAITVPIYRNDSETDDNNWNLIGNPYPSAIDVDLFFAANAHITPDNSSVSYQSSNGSSDYNTGITNVEFNTINNSDVINTNNNGYQDATNINTTVTRGASYDLRVKVDTEGNYTSHTFAWIDWNRDGDFNDNNETYDLGQDTNLENEETASSPFGITVPSSAVVGTTRMRVSSKYNGDPGSTETGFDGEVEDYSIIVTNSGGLDSAIFLWSQNTPPSEDNNGNQNNNFNTSDYAVINAAGQTAGGDGLMPNRHIPTGQGFFVSFNDDAIPTTTAGNIAQSNIVFNNTMRLRQNNTQFFSPVTVNNNEKLWLNLNSDNGVFNQILVAYVEGATDGDDGMSYDAPKNLSTEAAAILYSKMTTDSNKKYVIQGKNPSSMNEDEIISIGYKTEINVATNYRLSIEKFEGEFLSNNPIYIKDNFLNKYHNLKDGDYYFTSEVGEFNDRFQIVFSENSLSINDIIINKDSLSIIEHLNGDLQFKLEGNNVMTNIEIIDTNGRIIYNFKTSSRDEIFRLYNLSQAPYIARIMLENNFVITKKLIKRH